MIKDMATVYNPDKGFCWYDYTPMVESFGNILVRGDADDYQGDTWVILQEDDGRFGYLTFGWGSCSGCDALQACDTIKEVNKLAQDLYDSIKWFDTKDDLAKWFKSHDFNGDWCWHEEEFQEFYKQATEYLLLE